MPVINTGLTLSSLRSEFFNALDNTVTRFQDLTTRIESNSDVERYAFLGSVPPMREWGQGRLARGLFGDKYDVENLKYESTLEVDRDEISDDKTGQIKMRILELAGRAALHKDSLISSLLANGHSTGFNSYDGVSFFNTAHVSGKSGNQSNNITSIAANINAPTAVEFRLAVKATIAKLLSLKDDQGEPMNESISGLVIVCPPSMFLEMNDAMLSTVGVSINDGLHSGNSLRGLGPRIIVFPRLTAATEFYTLATDVPVRPFIFQDREPIEFTSLESQSEEGFKREKYLYGVRGRYRLTYGYWQHAVKCTFAVS